MVGDVSVGYSNLRVGDRGKACTGGCSIQRSRLVWMRLKARRKGPSPEFDYALKAGGAWGGRQETAVTVQMV